MEETQDYDKLYSKIKENYIIELNNELADELYDANDEDYVKDKFLSKYNKEYIHYSAFIFDNTRRNDMLKSELLNKFEDIYKSIRENPLDIFINEALPKIRTKFDDILNVPLKKDEIPLFDYEFYNKSDNETIIEYIAKYFALQKILKPSNEKRHLNSIEDFFKKLSQNQKALFFAYVREAGCISSFEDYGTGKLNGMQNLFNKYNMKGSFDAFKNKYNSFETNVKRLNKVKKEDLVVVIPLLIACPKAFDISKRELEHIKIFS